MQKEAKARIKINKLLEQAGWCFLDASERRANVEVEGNVKLEESGDDFEKVKKGFVDYRLLDENRFPICVLEAKSEDKGPLIGKEKARQYAKSQNVRYIILSNGNIHYFWDRESGNPTRISYFPSLESVKSHRDYSEYDSVNIAIFKDRIEIRNPGLLYGGLTIKQIREEMVSERRNELIAEMFHHVHFVEKWGRGISLILSKEPNTEFKEVGRHFIAIFKRKVVEERPSGEEKTREKTREKIIVLLTRKPGITTKDLSKEIGISVKGIEWQLSRLKKENMIKRIGSKKSGHWEVVKTSCK